MQETKGRITNAITENVANLLSGSLPYAYVSVYIEDTYIHVEVGTLQSFSGWGGALDPIQFIDWRLVAMAKTVHHLVLQIDEYIQLNKINTPITYNLETMKCLGNG